MTDKKVKVINPNNHNVGLELADGVRKVVVPKKSFRLLEVNDIYHINSISRIFSDKHLVIEDEEINQDLGYAENTVANFDDEGIEALLKGNHLKMQAELKKIDEKHIKDKVIKVAQGMNDLAQGKIKFLANWSGYEMDQIIGNEEEGDENEE